MKAGCLFLFLLFFSSFSQADNVKCEALSGIAKRTMELRQEGMPIATQVQSAEDLKDAVEMSEHEKEAAFDVIMAYIITAYEQPRFGTEEYRQRATTEFQNQAYLHCLKEM